MATSSSSDEDEEEKKKFAEIAGIVEKEQGKKNCSVVDLITAKPSLRNWRNQEEESEISSVLITPEFRKHIAKKLSSHLESCIEESKNYQETRKQNEKNAGILLLCSSKEMIMDTESSEERPNKPLSVTRTYGSTTDSSDSEDDEEMNRFSEAAVSGYSILACGTPQGTTSSYESDIKVHENNDHDTAEDCVSCKRKKKEKEELTKREKKKRKKEKIEEKFDSLEDSGDTLQKITKKHKRKKEKR